MVAGEGFSAWQVAGAAVAVGGMLAGFVWLFARAGRQIDATLAIGPVGPMMDLGDDDRDDLRPISDGMAEALVPEYAAGKRGCFGASPIHANRGSECGCAACRRRTSEPCSDFDEG
jgi:hypothetical protein